MRRCAAANNLGLEHRPKRLFDWSPIILVSCRQPSPLVYCSTKTTLPAEDQQGREWPVDMVKNNATFNYFLRVVRLFLFFLLDVNKCSSCRCFVFFKSLVWADTPSDLERPTIFFFSLSFFLCSISTRRGRGICNTPLEGSESTRRSAAVGK